MPEEVSVTFSDKAEKLEEALLNYPDQPVCPLEQLFAPGVYLRKITMPPCIGMGHKHKTEHFNIIMKGKVNVMIGDEVVQYVEAGDIFVSKPGDQKILHILEETVWLTVHANPDDITDEETLDNMMIEKSKTFLNHQEKLEEAESCHIG